MMQTHFGPVPELTVPPLAEDEGRGSAARFRALFGATTAGMVEVAPDARILRANDTFCRMTGYTSVELSAVTVADLLFPEDRDRVLTQYGEVATGPAGSFEAECRYRRKDGSALWARVSVVAQDETAKPTRVSAVVIDLTEQKQMEEQLWHAQKIETAGLLASCIAHDFNNLLTVINGYTQILLGELPDTGSSSDLVHEIASACERATGLTAQLLTFSRKAPNEPRTLDLNDVVLRSARLLRPLLGERITLVTDLTNDLGRVKADPAQVEQVILNLVVNAKDAMPLGGRLTIETRPFKLQKEERVSYPDLLPGEYVLLAVSDTGVGMTDEVKGRAFEPFFTTKTVGKGTGLGLAVVHGAIKRWGGRVDVASELGAGTTINILLPTIAPGAK
jgi:two-component system, cell cycle sensor histidine kinase and response regulator CckA